MCVFAVKFLQNISVLRPLLAVKKVSAVALIAGAKTLTILKI
jgi:hypothetical protein